MKKIIFVLLVLCGIFSIAPNVRADNMDGDYSIINNYTQLLEWRNAGCPSDGTNMIVVIRDFGWPTEEVVLDFGVKTSGTDVMLYHGNQWTIPGNVTIKNLNISLAEKATLNLEGKLHNNLYYEEGNPIEILRANKSTINLGENAEVKGSVHLCAESTLNANGGYAEEVIASVNSGTSSANLATISGTLVTDRLNHHNNMSINIAQNSTIEVGNIAGNSTNTVNIEKGATVFYTNTYASFMTNINIKSGGVMTLLFNPLTTEAIFTMEEGGVCNAYQGVNQRAQLSNAKIKGAGTINLYGMATFAYEGVDYWVNPNVEMPGTIPMLDATIIINEVSECDHAGGRAYRFVSYIPSGETEPTQHIQMCSSCRMSIEGTEAPHTYALEGVYDAFSRYRCVCGRSYTVDRTTGMCGEDITFVLDGETISFDGVGSITEFVPASGTWEEKSTTVKKVVLGSGITTVGENVFSACDNIEQVEYSGNYENWKALDIKAGNDALKYARISFHDGSCLLPAVGEYRTKADLLYKEESATGQFMLSLIPQSENGDTMTEDEMKKLKVFVVSYDGSETLRDMDLPVPTLKEDTGGAQWTGDIPSSAYRLFVWDENCTPLTR